MRNLKRVLALAMAMIMMLGMMVIGTSAASYKDAETIDANYAEAIEILTGMGVFKGQSTTESVFAPKAVLTRAEAAALIYRVITGDVADKQVQNYDYASLKDVQAGKWFTGYVTYANNGGYIKGDENGNFNPNASVTGVQVLAIMLRAAGYGQNGEYEGKAWKDNILTDAKELGIIGGISTATLDAPATRELVAQLIFNAITEVKMVTYNNLLGYVPVKWTSLETAGQTLGQKVFKLTKTVAGHGDWGRPYDYKWVKGTTVLYTAWEAPLATYTKSTKDCDIYADTGLKAGTKLDVYTNSNTADGIYTIKDSAKTSHGLQGRLTEVYSNCVVNIDTYLAEIVKVVAEKADSRGHVTPAYVVAEVYMTGNDEVTVKNYETDDFAANDVVLVTVLDGEIMTMELAQSAVASLTKVAGNIKAIDDIQKVMGLNKADVTVNHTADDEPNMVLGKTYVFYYDQYDNVIGAADLATNYVVLDSIYTSVSAGKDTNTGTVVFFNAEKDEDVTIASVDGQKRFGPTKGSNDAYYYTVYAYTEKDGVYTLTDSDFNYADDGEYRAGSKYMMISDDDETNTLQLSKNSTILLQNTASPNGTYKAYTGYADLPSFEAEDVQYTLDANGYVDMLYAYVWEFSSRTVFVYDTKPVYTWTEDGETFATLKVLELVDGEMKDTTVDVYWSYADDEHQAWAYDIDSIGLYDITEGEAGIWYAIEEHEAYEIEKVTEDGKRVEINGRYAVLDDAKIVKYVGSTVKGKYDLNWSTRDLTADGNAFGYVQFNEDGTVAAVYDLWIAVNVVFDEDAEDIDSTAKIEAPVMYLGRDAKAFTVSVSKWVKVASVANDDDTDDYTATSAKAHYEARTFSVNPANGTKVEGNIFVTLAEDKAHTEAWLDVVAVESQNLTVTIDNSTNTITVETNDGTIKVNDVAAFLKACGTHNKGMQFYNNTKANPVASTSTENFEIDNLFVIVTAENGAEIRYDFAAAVTEEEPAPSPAP